HVRHGTAARRGGASGFLSHLAGPGSPATRRGRDARGGNAEATVRRPATPAAVTQRIRSRGPEVALLGWCGWRPPFREQARAHVVLRAVLLPSPVLRNRAGGRTRRRADQSVGSAGR